MCEDIQARVSGLVAELREKLREKGSRACAPRGAALQQAIDIINGERQDVYGSPEDSFALIARYWQTYLESRPGLMTFMGAKPDHADPLGSEDVALMMVLFKLAREANQHKRDNIIDAAGYLGIYADMQEDRHDLG